MAIPPHATDSVLKTVGRTPLVRLASLERAGGPRLFAKCEFTGPGSSIFDRAAAAEFAAADRGGHLVDQRGVVAAGGTDASISLALVASASGHALTLFVPKSLAPERRRALLDYGATLESLDDDTGFAAANELAFDRAAATHSAYVSLFEGRIVTQAYEALGAEILEALGAAPTETICGLDLGAIPTGLARGLGGGKVVAVEPSQARVGSGGAFSPHILGGLVPGPDLSALDRALVNTFEAVDEREAWTMAEELSRTTGILAGIVSGAVLVAAKRRMQSLSGDQTVVAVLPDSGERRFMLADFFT
jgi:cysteine synthase A